MYTYLKAIINLPNGVKFFFLTELIIGIGGGIWGLNFNFLMKSKGFSLSEIGKIIAVSPLVTALFSLPAGYLCDRSGYKRSMIAGCASRAAAMFIAFLADSTGLIYLSRILTGIGDSFVLTSSYPYITSMVTEEKRSMVYSLLFSCMMFSSFLGSTAGGFLLKVIKDSDRYEISIIIAFIIMFVVTIMRCFLPKASVKREKGEKARIYIPRQKFLFAYLLNDFIGFISYFIGTSMLNLILRDVMKMSDSFTGITLGLSTIMSSVAVFIVPHVTSRFRGTKVGSLALWIL
ncbi:MAG: MFS transporter, partial [Bacillota bacterium]|nr:MFS transporter [Bacillota bacterium]